MSYYLVKSIGINEKENKVYLSAACNNVTPKYYKREECHFFTNILKEHGRRKTELAILEDYISGNLQGGSNKFTKALKLLRRNPTFIKFDWKQDWENHNQNKKTFNDEYLKLLNDALITRLPKEKYLLAKETGETGTKQTVYACYRSKSRFLRWTLFPEKAKKFDFKEDVENMKKWFTGSDNWFSVLFS